MWTRLDPVSVGGAAGPVRTGWTEVEKSFRWIAGRFSDCSSYDLDIITADVRGDLAYVVCWERAKLRMDGEPSQDNCAARHPHLPPRARRVEERPPPR